MTLDSLGFVAVWFAFVFLVALASSVLAKVKFRGSAHWPTADGEIISGAICGFRAGKRVVRAAQLSYSFKIESEFYGGYFYEITTDLEGYLKQWTAGSSVVVRYKVANPGVSMLRPQDNPGIDPGRHVVPNSRKPESVEFWPSA
jgi:hypothetical protein